MKKPQIAVMLVLVCCVIATAQPKLSKKSRSSSAKSVAGKPGAAKQDAAKPGATEKSTAKIKHALLISIDGLHALDLATYIANRPDSTLAQLSKRGIIYSNASTPIADSTPGLLALVTGGTPNSTGVYYSDGYDRTLSPPRSGCATRGAVITFDETADKDPDAEDAGGGMDPEKMALDPQRNCSPVFPHNFLRVNTIFEVVKKSGGKTAWSDQHPTFGDFLLGPSGTGVDDLYTPEAHAPGVKKGIAGAEKHDALKVQAVLNQIKGLDHTGARQIGVPKLFGMTFITVSVVQKLAGNGYLDGSGTPSPGLQGAMDWTDNAIGQMVKELKDRDLFDSTLIVISAKHGQSPIDQTKRKLMDEGTVPDIVEGVQKGLLAHSTVDTVAFLWLKDQSKTAEVVKAIEAKQVEAGIQEIYSGESLKLKFPDPQQDPRAPDIIVQPILGVMYSEPSTKLAEHGGFLDQDTDVSLLVSIPGAQGQTVKTPVATTQVAPTILKALGLDPNSLQSVQIEHTEVLPWLPLQ